MIPSYELRVGCLVSSTTVRVVGIVPEEVDVEVSDEAQSALGLGAMTCDFAEWFCVPHEVAHEPDGDLFSPKTGGDGRRVVLTLPNGPNALVFPRSTRTESYQGHPHDAHAGRCDGEECKISDFGHVLVSLPLRVDADYLTDPYYSCTEPNGSLLDFLRRGRRL